MARDIRLLWILMVHKPGGAAPFLWSCGLDEGLEKQWCLNLIGIVRIEPRGTPMRAIECRMMPRAV